MKYSRRDDGLKGLLRKISLMMTVVITIGYIGTVNVYANELTGLAVTNMAVPAAGVAFSDRVTVASAEGVSWDIPVIWADESGKTVRVPEGGKRYIPTFVFYVPNGHSIANADSSGKISIKFPAFLTAAAGADKFLYVADPANNIIYIIYAPGYVVSGAAAATNTGAVTSTASSETNNSSNGDTPGEAVSEQVRLYCDDNVINKLGNDYLEWLVHYVKNVVQPQAVNLLKKNFPLSYGCAVPGKDLSENIGLYIYYEDGILDGVTTTGGSMAFVHGAYDDNINKYKLAMGVDASKFTRKNEETGEWEMDPAQQDNFGYTILHEMMHAFMDDYTRYGMVNTPELRQKGQSFPNWFIEGSATTVENAYTFRYEDYVKMADISNGINYTNDSVLAAYKDEENGLDLNLYKASTSSEYAMGAVAIMYLGYLYDKNMLGNPDAITVDNGNYNVNMSAIRNGFDNILLDLHGRDDEGNDARTLDALIQAASNYDETAGTGYAGALDYEQRFIKGKPGEESDAGSLDFTAKYLQWLEQYPVSDGVEHANGSILSYDENDDQNYRSIIDPQKEETADLYVIPEESGTVPSTASDVRANTTGGTSTVGDGTYDYLYDE